MTNQEMPKPFASSFDPRDFGATGDGKQLDTRPVQKALDASSAIGGGTVRLTRGTYLIGTLFLRSNVTLHLEPAATLLGSTDLRDYSASVARCGFTKEPHLDKCLIYAGNVENIAITGRGTIDGQGAAVKG